MALLLGENVEIKLMILHHKENNDWHSCNVQTHINNAFLTAGRARFFCLVASQFNIYRGNSWLRHAPQWPLMADSVTIFSEKKKKISHLHPSFKLSSIICKHNTLTPFQRALPTFRKRPPNIDKTKGQFDLNFNGKTYLMWPSF